VIVVRVLSLVTTDRARFYRQEVDGLKKRGVRIDTLSVPGSYQDSDGAVDARSPLDYVRFYGSAISESFGEYDLVHANYGLTAPPAVVQPNLPTVLTLWGSDLLGRYGPMTRWCARAADAVIVMSPEMAEALGRPCHIIPHGVDTERFQPEPQRPAQETVGWRADRYHVLFPYSPERPVKNYQRAKRVVERADRQFDRRVELHSITGVPHHRVSTYMNAADALLLTSESEGSPNSVKEALACNLPVVSVDVGDVSLQLRDVTPSVVASSDAELVDGLVDVLERGGRSNGRVMVDDIRMDNQIRKVHDVYRDVVRANERSPKRTITKPLFR